MSTTFDVAVEVSLREGIADPEGLTIERALPALGFSGVSGVRVERACALWWKPLAKPKPVNEWKPCANASWPIR